MVNPATHGSLPASKVISDRGKQRLSPRASLVQRRRYALEQSGRQKHSSTVKHERENNPN